MQVFEDFTAIPIHEARDHTLTPQELIAHWRETADRDASTTTDDGEIYCRAFAMAANELEQSLETHGWQRDQRGHRVRPSDDKPENTGHPDCWLTSSGTGGGGDPE